MASESRAFLAPHGSPGRAPSAARRQGACAWSVVRIYDLRSPLSESRAAPLAFALLPV
jgi:hypothetical protein